MAGAAPQPVAAAAPAAPAAAPNPPSALSVPHVALAAAALVLPSLLAWNVPPSTTFLNQALALALWGWFVAFTAAPLRSAAGAAAPALVALALLGVGVLWSWRPGALPASLALPALGLLAAAAVTLVAGASAHARRASAEYVAYSAVQALKAAEAAKAAAAAEAARAAQEAQAAAGEAPAGEDEAPGKAGKGDKGAKGGKGGPDEERAEGDAAAAATAQATGRALPEPAGAAASGPTPPAAALFTACCVGFALAGLPNVLIAAVQVFAPQLADGDWIARSAILGRAVGNLRQPNHLSSLLLWSAIAVVALLELGRLGRQGRWVAWPCFALLLGAVVLTASRTGMVGAVLLGLWGLADRRLSRPGRVMLMSAPLCYGVVWGLMAAWAHFGQQAFGGAARLSESVESSSRVGIWVNTLKLIEAYPFGGVGFGEFNFAWTLSAFPGRPVAFFDHTHNLVLQLAVELGLPMAAIILALLTWALWRALRRAWGAKAEGGPNGAARRCAIVMVLMIGLHSMLEYPLWYAYFLLPAAWCLGFALGRPQQEPSTEVPRAWPMAAAGMLVLAGALAAVADFTRVVPIFHSRPGAPPLDERIERGQRSVLFAHHAHYAAATTSTEPEAELASLQQAAHHLLDTRLMITWARAYAGVDDMDRARYLAARLREFHNPAADEFFSACPREGGKVVAVPAQEGAGLPFQCILPERRPRLGWESFIGR